MGEERARSLGLADVNYYTLGFPGGSVVKIRLSMQGTREMRFRSLGQEYPLEEEMEPTPVFLPEKSHGQRSLVGCSPWGLLRVGRD